MEMNINDCISGFTLINREEIDDINSEGYLFLHKKSGARLMYIENDDDNKVFFISFKTPPEDDCGTPHIIEHSVSVSYSHLSVFTENLKMMRL